MQPEEFIQQVILTNQFIEQPFRVAHQYARTPLIMYHIMRLMNKFNIPELEICRDKLERDILNYLKNEDLEMMDRILLEISLKNNIAINKNNFRISNLNILDTDSPFFIAGLLTAYENPILYKISSSKLFHINWTCEAHSLTLLAEWMVATSKETINFQ
jgi:hypothetical protein